jgi:predicted small metal-binding protein
VAKTIACVELNKTCDYRIIAGDDQTDFIVETTTLHAKKYHPEMAIDEPKLRDSIKAHIHSLMLQSHTDPDLSGDLARS